MYINSKQDGQDEQFFVSLHNLTHFLIHYMFHDLKTGSCQHQPGQYLEISLIARK